MSIFRESFLNEGLFRNKEKEVKKYYRWVDQIIGLDDKYEAGFGYNYTESIGILLMAKFRNIPESDIIKYLLKLDETSTLAELIDSVNCKENDFKNIDINEKIFIIGEDPVIYLSHKTKKVYQIINVYNSEKPSIIQSSIYKDINENLKRYEKMYFSKKEYEKYFKNKNK